MKGDPIAKVGSSVRSTDRKSASLIAESAHQQVEKDGVITVEESWNHGYDA